MTATSALSPLFTLRSFAGTRPNIVQPSVADTGVKASMHSCSCESVIVTEPVDEVIFSKSLFEDSGSVGL